MSEPLIASLDGATPDIHPSAWLAPGSVVIGDVSVGPASSVFYGAVVRGDLAEIRIGAGTNVQDNATLHVDPGHPMRIGDRVSIGHNAVLHGCIVEDGCLIGMNATILNGARIGRGSLIAAGALITAGMTIPERSLVAGVPGTVRRQLDEIETEDIAVNAATYAALMERHRASAESLR